MARSPIRLVLLAVIGLTFVSGQAVLRADDRSQLISAVRQGDRDGLAALLKKGVDVNATEADGSTALMWASYRDDGESAALLIQAGANTNIANELLDARSRAEIASEALMTIGFGTITGATTGTAKICLLDVV